MNDERFRLGDEAGQALSERRAVVAVETVVLTHGLPQHVRLDTAARMDAAIRTAGAVPAFVGLIRGVLCVGVKPEALFAACGANALKASLSTLAIGVAQVRSGGTTVAGTLAAAALARIPVAVAGGIGGLHRGWQQDLDVSGDLTALARHPVALVCSGPKALLDVPATMEALEGLGVPVIGLGVDRAPVFYHNRSTVPVERIASARQAAEIAAAHFDLLAGSGGVLVLNPVPEGSALDADQVEAAVASALREAHGAHVTGPAVTPLLQAAILRATGGASAMQNQAMLVANAELAGHLAVELSLLRARTQK
jgi:pseudouridine-5'-phosphate glycosidase